MQKCSTEQGSEVTRVATSWTLTVSVTNPGKHSRFVQQAPHFLFRQAPGTQSATGGGTLVGLLLEKVNCCLHTQSRMHIYLHIPPPGDIVLFSVAIFTVVAKPRQAPKNLGKPRQGLEMSLASIRVKYGRQLAHTVSKYPRQRSAAPSIFHFDQFGVQKVPPLPPYSLGVSTDTIGLKLSSVKEMLKSKWNTATLQAGLRNQRAPKMSCVSASLRPPASPRCFQPNPEEEEE